MALWQQPRLFTPRYRGKGSPFPPLGLPSSGGLGTWEPERNGALWDQLDRNQAGREGGDTGVGWQALLYPLVTLGPPNCLKALDQVTSVLPGTLVDCTWHRGPQESVAAPRSLGGRQGPGPSSPLGCRRDGQSPSLPPPSTPPEDSHVRALHPRDPCPQENLRRHSVNGFNPIFVFPCEMRSQTRHQRTLVVD